MAKTIYCIFAQNMPHAVAVCAAAHLSGVHIASAERCVTTIALTIRRRVFCAHVADGQPRIVYTRGTRRVGSTLVQSWSSESLRKAIAPQVFAPSARALVTALVTADSGCKTGVRAVVGADTGLQTVSGCLMEKQQNKRKLSVNRLKGCL